VSLQPRDHHVSADRDADGLLIRQQLLVWVLLLLFFEAAKPLLSRPFGIAHSPRKGIRKHQKMRLGRNDEATSAVTMSGAEKKFLGTMHGRSASKGARAPIELHDERRNSHRDNEITVPRTRENEGK
jgi:hypothetical protein